MRAALFAVLALAATAAAPAAPPPDLRWLAGDWGECGVKITEEHWVYAGPGEMLSIGLTREFSGEKYDYEFVRIGRDGDGWAFFANPSGQHPAKFPMVEIGKDRVVFENPAHDFPTRVAYWRDGAGLMASIEGPGGKGRQTWSYSRIDGPFCIRA